MASSTLSTTTGDSPSPLQRAPARRQSRGQQQYSDNQTYPYAFHPRDDSVLLHVQRLIVLAIFSPLMVLSWILHKCRQLVPIPRLVGWPGSSTTRSPGVKKKRPRTKPTDFTPPPAWLLQLLALPFAVVNPPRISGLEHLTGALARGEKVMLVGNQTLLGLDQLVLMALVYVKCGILLRRLHDALFSKIPLVREILGFTGGVGGTKRNCEELMKDGQPLLFFPGGIAESFKARATPPYSLLWGDRLGFVHMAIKHGYTLVPFASVGIEDALWVLLRLPLQPLLRLLGEARPPIAFPVLGLYNSFERQYFRFGPPVPTRQYDGAYEDPAFCQEAFALLQTRAQALLAEAKDMQRRDPARYVSGRLLLGVKRLLVFGLGPPPSPPVPPSPSPAPSSSGPSPSPSAGGGGAAAAAASAEGAQGASPQRKEEGKGVSPVVGVAGESSSSNSSTSPLQQRKRGGRE